MSTLEKRRASSATLTTTLRQGTRYARADDAAAWERNDMGNLRSITVNVGDSKSYVDREWPVPYNFQSAATVKILMIAPEPFFEPRGTPFSEFHRIRALTELGHTVDLVTYPFGEDVSIPGLRVFRSMRPVFVRHVGIGPSVAKIPLDLL